MRDHTHPAVAFHAMALVAAARAALNAARSVADRRAGRDASAQEPEGLVREDLGELSEAMAAQVVRLRVRSAVGMPGGTAAALAQAFEDRILLDDVTQTVRVVHQKLLSLYPAVSEALAEEARVIASHSALLNGPEEDGLGLGDLAERLGAFRDDLARSLD